MNSFEGDTEHAIAGHLLQEINATPLDDECVAKVKVLAQMVKHDSEEEETKILKDVREQISETARQNIGVEYTRLHDEYQTFNLRQIPRRRKFLHHD